MAISIGVSTYTQDFDTLSNTTGSTTNVLSIPGWAMTETGGGARDNEQYAVDTGASNTGDTYSYGSTGSTERAFGGLQSGTLIPVFGAEFSNAAGGIITALTIAYTGEQWRLGTAARTDRIDFQISFDATSLTTGTWSDVDALDFVTPTTEVTGAKDGNAAANRTAITSTITGLSIADGATFWIRWTDFNASGADDGLAVDDFSLDATTGPAVPTVTLSVSTAAASESSPAAITVTARASAPVTGDQTVTLVVSGIGITAGDFTLSSSTITIPAGLDSGSVTFTVVDDALVEGPETATLTISSPSAGIAIGTPSSQDIAIADNDAAPPPPAVLINEIDSDTPGTDVAEFVELFGAPNSSLAGLVLVFYNGANDLSYFALDLDPFSLDANGYFVAGNAGVPGVNAVFANGTLQNGADAVAIYAANGSDFPNGTAVRISGLVDAIVYDTADADDTGLLALLNAGQPQVDESGGGAPDTHAIARLPNGSGGARNTGTFVAQAPTPGASNDPAPPPPAQPFKIHEIQGAGATSPLLGQGVIVEAIVVADFQGDSRLRGFYLQEEDADVAATRRPRRASSSSSATTVRRWHWATRCA